MKKNTVLLKMLLYMFWGFNWVVMSNANHYFPSMFFVMLRFMIGAVVLLLVCTGRGKLIPPRKCLPWLIISGILMMSVNNVMIQTSMKYISAGLAAVLDYMQSIFVCIFAVFLLGERFTLRKVAGIAFSVAGLLILMNVNRTGHLGAIFLALGAAAVWACSNIIVKLKLSDCDMLQCTAWQMASGSCFLFLFLLLVSPETLQEGLASLFGGAAMDPVGLGTVLYNGLIASALAFVLWNSILTEMEAGTASIAIMGVPAVGVLCGVLILHEPMNLSIALGMILIFTGIFVVLRPGVKR